MAKRFIQRDRKCAQCGTTPITGTKYCSIRCGQTYRDRAIGIQSWAERYPQPDTAIEHQCVVCQVGFVRKSRGRDAALCCSRECGFQLIRQRAERTRRVAEAKREFERWAKAVKERPKACASWAERYAAQAEARWAARAVKPCIDCGCAVGRDRTRIYPAARCADCALKAKRERSHRSPSHRADKAYRKALHRGAVAGAERFDPIEVLERDGWRCHICRCATPKRLRGSYDDRAPELDHIIPLASGGMHTRLNTACACRRCNMTKGAKPLGQLRLLA